MNPDALEALAAHAQDMAIVGFWRRRVVRLAALKVSNGDIARLCEAIDLAALDWRDLLVAAGFAEDALAHLEWMPAPK